MIEKIAELESKNVFIHTQWEHYKDGSNLNFSIEFRSHGEQTMWYNDNHEFGNGSQAMAAAIKMAEGFLARPEWIFELNLSVKDQRKTELERREFINSLRVKTV